MTMLIDTLTIAKTWLEQEIQAWRVNFNQNSGYYTGLLIVLVFSASACLFAIHQVNLHIQKSAKVK
jgi:hypothetical protein